MKKNILYSLFIATSMSLTACSSFLEESPVDQMPEAEAYKNPEMIYLNTVANLYTKVGHNGGGWGLQGTDRGLYDLNTFTADEAMLPTRGGDWDDGGLWRNLFQHNWGVNNDIVISVWDYLYNVIVQCNTSIDKLNELESVDPENPYYGIYKSEVRAFRAMYYYYLLDLFARVPIVESSTTEMKDVKQSERSEVFAFVKKELEESLPDLADEMSASTGEYYGRMTKSVAHFLLAKIAINAEVYTDNDWTDATRPDGKNIKFTVDGQEMNCWEATIAYCNKLANSGYKLNAGTNGFAANFAINNEGSAENIFVIPMDPKSYKSEFYYHIRSQHYDVGKAFGHGGWNGACATLEAMNAFGYNTPQADPRLELTYRTGKVKGPDGNFVQNSETGEDLEYLPMAVKLNFDKSDTNMKMAGARMLKYEYDATATNEGKNIHNDIVLFRYADAVLMRAEAKVRNGESGQTDLNEVRNRVGAPVVDATLNNILRERLLELAWEGWRRQDLVRFGQFNKAITDRPTTKPYLTVFPIHANTLAVNTNLTQNHGY